MDVEARLAAAKAHVAAGVWPPFNAGGVKGDIVFLIDLVTALRGRTIPEHFVAAPLLSIIADFNDDRVETIMRTVTPTRNGWIHDIDFHDARPSVLSPAFDTLAEVLVAADTKSQP